MRTVSSLTRTFTLLGALAVAAAWAVHAPSPAGAAPTPTATPTTPEQLFRQIRAVFRSHRPPPPYETYTIVRTQNTNYNTPDLDNSYTYHVWVRTADKAALGRRVYMSFHRGTLEFQRPAFNEDRDPGPPTADLFEPAPVHPHDVSWVPTPEPTSPGLSEIAVVKVTANFDYRVTNVAIEGPYYHLSLTPIRDPDRNRLREIYADRKTLELHKVVATDKLFILPGKDVYPVIFTITLQPLDGIPVVTHIHGIVGGGYDGDGQQVDYDFKDIEFPSSLPAWYFDPHSYASHQDDAPS